MTYEKYIISLVVFFQAKIEMSKASLINRNRTTGACWSYMKFTGQTCGLLTRCSFFDNVTWFTHSTSKKRY